MADRGSRARYAHTEHEALLSNRERRNKTVRLAARVLLVLVVLFFAVSFSRSVSTMLSLSNTLDPGPPGQELPNRRISVFLPEPTTPFLMDVQSGVASAAEALGLSVSYHPIAIDAPEFGFAEYTGIEGAIIYPTFADPAAFRTRLQQIRDAGVSLVLIEQDIEDAFPWTYVGTNYFEMGRQIGEHIGASRGERIVVVYSDKSPAVASEQELVELGITSAMGALDARLAAPIVRERTGLNPLDAESLTSELVRREPAITTVVFTNTNDTLAAVQVIVDLNLVGQIRVIGFGESESADDYLERGVLDAIVVLDPVGIGDAATRVLAELMDTGNAPGYVDAGVRIRSRGGP